MILPNLFIPGAAKSGTSSLHEYLGQHPNIFMSSIKEPHFFSHDENFSKGILNYSKLFESAGNYKVRGESSTGYMVFPKVIERIKQMIPNPKFIFIFRNPVDRAYSHYWWLKGMGYEDFAFQAAFLRDMEVEPSPDNTTELGYKYYYQFGCYAKWILRYYDNFGKKDIHILTTERMRVNPLATLNECFKFLGLDEMTTLETTKSNETNVLRHPKVYHSIDRSYKLMKRIVPALLKNSIFNYTLKSAFNKSVKEAAMKISMRQNTYPKLTKTERYWIADFYRQDVASLQKLTGQRFEDWVYDFSYS